MTARRAFVHIGKHKTGTTSFQAYLHDHEASLQKQGIQYVPLNISNAIAAGLIRDGLPIPPVKSILEAGGVPSRAAARDKLAAFVAGKDFGTLLFSSEHLSYFRAQSEIDAFQALLNEVTGIAPADISICVTFRNPEDFLRSYKSQIIKRGHGMSRDPASPYYVEPDSWLADDAAIKTLWETNFSRLDVLRHEDGNTVLQLCKAMGLPIEDSAETYQANKTNYGLKNWIKCNLPDPLLKLAVSTKRKLSRSS